jgi:hypothetical protein
MKMIVYILTILLSFVLFTKFIEAQTYPIDQYGVQYGIEGAVMPDTTDKGYITFYDGYLDYNNEWYFHETEPMRVFWHGFGWGMLYHLHEGTQIWVTNDYIIVYDLNKFTYYKILK